MFDKIRRKAKQIFEQEVRESSNSGRIHTVAVITELFLLGAAIFASRRNSSNSHSMFVPESKSTPTIRIGTINIYMNQNVNEDEEEDEDDN